MEIYHPRGEDEVLALVQAAVAAKAPLEITGHGSKRGLGHAVEAEAVLDTSELSGVTLYEPAELVLRARPGTPMTEIAALLDNNDQELAFEPMDPTPAVARQPAGHARRHDCGQCRRPAPDQGRGGARSSPRLSRRERRGDIFQSGGRVMKNVTGYDLSKLITGSHGTLAVMTEITLKVLPKAETQRTLVVEAPSEAACLGVLRKASGLPQEVSSYACLPDGGLADLPPGPCALLRLEGPQISVAKRFEDLVTAFGPAGRLDDLGAEASARLWAALRDATPVAEAAGPVWKISTVPGEAYAYVEALRSAGVPLARWYYDWAGGLVWLGLEAGAAHAEAIRGALPAHGGHATLMRAEDGLRAATPVFHPQPPALAALSRRVKASFDPLDILNRGRLGLKP